MNIDISFREFARLGVPVTLAALAGLITLMVSLDVVNWTARRQPDPETSWQINP